MRKTYDDIANPKCKIDSCKYYNTCDKVQVKGENVKCINYKSIFDKS